MLRDIEGNNIETFEERNERVAKHTEGPWRVMQGSINFPPLLVRANGLDKAIADCDYQDGDEGAANARLIAAAPEMLEVLELLHRLTLQTPSLANDPDSREVMDQAWVIIHKARGNV